MHDYLRGTRTEVAVQCSWEPAAYAMCEGWEQLHRAHPPVVPAAERVSSLQVIEEAFPAEAGRAQAARCLRCNVNTVFDTGMCVACTGCVDICPQDLIRLTGLAELCRTEEGREQVAALLAVTPAELEDCDSAQLDSLGAVMLKDETTCIRCGLCAARCPSHAITMQRFNYRRHCITLPGGNGQAKPEFLAQERP
jgi:ferredoxin